MRHQHRLFTGFLIVLFGLFAAHSVVAFDTEQSATGSNSCNAQAADSGDATVPPYMEHIVTDVPSDGYANLPPYSKDPTVSPTTRTARDDRPRDTSVIAAATEAAEIHVPVALAPVAYAAHTELFAVAADCDEVLAPTSTVPATCSRCESTAF